jgi:hydroxymethylpyrimidine pyrophosphatase-like HAD family hydrolase
MRPVLCVDLDGTLIEADTLRLAFWRLVLTRPWRAVLALMMIPHGRARFKQAVAEAAPFDAASLPYHAELLAFLISERQAGTRLILATGADRRFAEAVALHLHLFDTVLASDGALNLTGKAKADRIEACVGSRNFIYIGDSSADIPVWHRAQAAIVAGRASNRIAELTRLGIRVTHAFPPARGRSRTLPSGSLETT